MSATVTAREFAAHVGGVDLDVLRAHHVDLAVIAAELAHDARMDWPWTPDDPTVALLRALARISIVAPDARSSRATALHRCLGERPVTSGPRAMSPTSAGEAS